MGVGRETAGLATSAPAQNRPVSDMGQRCRAAMFKTLAPRVPDMRYSGRLFWTSAAPMPASTFTVVYARVSTPEQNPENQLAEIEAAGYQPDATPRWSPAR